MQLHRESHDRTRTAHSPPRPSASTAAAAPPQRRTTNLSVRRGVSLSLSRSRSATMHIRTSCAQMDGPVRVSVSSWLMHLGWVGTAGELQCKSFTPLHLLALSLARTLLLFPARSHFIAPAHFSVSFTPYHPLSAAASAAAAASGRGMVADR